MTDEEKIELIMEYAEKHPKFETGFVESLENFLDKFGSLTENQSAALDNIIYKFRITEDDDGD